MKGTQWQEQRGNRLGFLGASFLSIVCVGALVAISLTIASTGNEQAAAPIEGPAAPAPIVAQPEESVPPAAIEKSAETTTGKPAESSMGDEMIAHANGTAELPEEKQAAAERQESETIPASAVPEGPVTWNDGETAFGEKRYADAAEIFERYAQDRPENGWGYYMLGLSRWKTGNLEGAEEALRQSISLDSKHAKSRINLARVLIDLDRAEEALGPIRSVLEAEPDHVAAWRILGRTAHSIGVLEEAIYAYNEALVRNGEDTWSLNNLGLILIERGDFSEAIGPLARAVVLDNEVAVFQNNLGMALENSGHLVQAAELYSRAVELDEAYDKAAVNLARVEPLVDVNTETAIDLIAIADAWSPGGVGEELAQSSP